MGEYIVKILTDILFYLAIFMPGIQIGGMPIRILLVLIPMCWSVWVKLNWKQRNFMESIQDHFFLQSRVLVLASLLEIFVLGFELWSKSNGIFVVGFVVVGILAMKTGRIAEGNQRKGIFWLICGLEIAAILAVVWFLSSDAFIKGILSLLGNGYKTLILPVLLFFVRVLIGILERIWPYVMQIFSRNEVRFQSQENFTISGELNVELEQAEQVAGAGFLKIFGMMAAVLLVGLFLWYLWRKFSQTSGTSRQMEGTVSRSALSSPETHKEKKPLFGGERNVRYYYRKFMELCRKENGWGTEIVTTEHVHETARECWDDEESLISLRDLYRDVRYGGKEDGAEERKRAKRIYKKLKGLASEKSREELQK